MENRTGKVYSFSDLKEHDLEVQDIEPAHAQQPDTFVLSANGERYRNTRPQRRKARRAQKASRRQNR